MMSEKKQTAVNLIAKIISYGTTLLISFFLTPYLVDKLGKEAYSFYPIANNFVNYMGVITIALNSMASRFITIHLTQGNKKRANTYFVSILYSNVIMSLVLLIPMIIIIVFLPHILNIPPELLASVKLLFALVFISMLVNLFTNVLGVAVFSQNRMDLSSVTDIIVGTSRVVLYVLLFWLFEPNIAYVGVVSLAVALIQVVIQRYYTKKLLPFMSFSRKYFRVGAVKEVVSSGIWNSVNQIGVVLLSTIGLMMCNKLYGAADAADYSIALTIPNFINGIVSMLSSVFLPGLTIKYARGNKKEIIDHVHMAQNVIGMIDNIPTAVFMAVGVNFFRLWTPSVDPYRLQVLSILAIGYLLVTSVAWPISNLNTVMNKVKVPAIVMVITGLVNILLIYLTYRFTNLGVYAIPLGQMILFILNRVLFVGIYSAHCLKEKWYIFYPAIIKNFISAAIIFGISYFVNSIFDPMTWLGLVVECAILGIIALCINAVIVFKLSGIKKIVGQIVLFMNRKMRGR